jgi:hypothetical protein
MGKRQDAMRMMQYWPSQESAMNAPRRGNREATPFHAFMEAAAAAVDW